MATVTGTLKTYNQVGTKENVLEFIYDISPTDTPFLTAIGTSKAHNTLHQWQTDELAPTQQNAKVEGADAGTASGGTTTMLHANTQILDKVIQTSGSADAMATYGRGKELAYQKQKAAKELKRDIEFAMVGNNQTGTAGNATTARQLKSAQNWIDVATTDTHGSNRALTETIFESVLEKCYTEGGEPSMMMVTPRHAKIIAGFANAAGRTRDFNTGTKIVNKVNLYVSPVGEVSVVLNRHLQANTMMAIDPNYWSRAVYRPVQIQKLAPTGDSTKMQMLTELTLVCKAPKASGLASALTA